MLPAVKVADRPAILRGFHDGLNPRQIVEVESGHALAMFGRVIKSLTKRNEGHETSRDYEQKVAPAQ